MEKDKNGTVGELTPQLAIERLVQAIYVAQSRGAWKLEEVPELLRAIKVFTSTTAPPSTSTLPPNVPNT